MLKTLKLFIKDFKLNVKKHLNKYHGEEYPWFQYYENTPKSIDYPKGSMYELISIISKTYPHDPAYQYFGKKISYKEFNEEIISCAKGLKEIGVKKGDIISICMANTPEAIILFYAVNMLGGVANMIHPLASVDEMKLYFQKSNSKYVLTLDLVYEKMKQLDQDLNLEKIIISKINNKMPSYMSLLYQITKKPPKIKYDNKVISFKTLNKLGIKTKLPTKIKVRAKDDAVIMYSGGTTGNPKGVVLTNLNINAMCLQAYTAFYPVSQKDSVLAVLPIFHNFGLAVSVHSFLAHGLKITLVPGFNAKDFGKLILKNKPNFIFGVPTMYEALINSNIKKKDYLKSVHTVVVGGDTLTQELGDRLIKYLQSKGCRGIPRMGYGLSEISGACTLAPRNFFKEGVMGIPFPDMLIKIVDPVTYEELAPGEIGEICVYGPTVMSRYLNDIRETKNVMRKHNDRKTWFHTGDMGYMTEDGMFYFKSRIKRMIVSNGYNIYPQYLETQLKKHPAIEDCVVVGVPHKYKQMVPNAYIKLNKDFLETDLLKDEIKDFADKRINKYEKINEFVYVDEFPETLMGKVAFMELGKDE